MHRTAHRPRHLLASLSPIVLSIAACGGGGGDAPPETPRFTVGGSIGGLAATGLVLANGSDRLTLAAGATGFTMPTTVAQGAGFSVAVQAQPTGQTCAVAGGNGTMGSANVNSVAVTCTTNTFSVGGSIAGLVSGGLVLANGSDTLAVDASSAGFTLPTPVPFGGAFAVTVQAQPTGLTCSVAGGSGTVAAAVSNVAVTCSPNAFSVGGSITGLISGELVLANGTETLTVGANASTFTLPTAVAFGSDFNVTVQAQPAGLTCTVAGGSGTMDAANVTSVAVTCSPLAFTLGGSVSGLTASGLVLANGADTVAVAANATGFTLPSAVAFGSAFNVSVQGRAEGQTCTVAGGSGTMGAANVSSVAVSCGEPTFSVSTFAGTGATGSTNGNATVARFRSPRGVAVDGSGRVYVADADNNLIRRISPAGVVSTFAGSGATGASNGSAAAASFNRPRSVAVDGNGTVYVADQDNHVIRKITAAGVVSTLAGSGAVVSADGTGSAASFNLPFGIAVDSAGNVYVADLSNNKIRKITPEGVVSTLAGSGAAGSTNGSGAAATFTSPAGVAVDADGNVFVAELGQRVRKVTAAGVVSTVAGTGVAGGTDGAGTVATFSAPQGVAIGRDGSLFVIERAAGRLRRIAPDGAVSTLAGTGAEGNNDGVAASAQFRSPQGLAIDARGDVYVADSANNKIRRFAQD